MTIKLIQQRINSYQAKSHLEEENAIKEITQEIALSGLSRAGFFKTAVFQGGTALRILHGLNRFSEDLDFSLQKPNPSFDWKPYLKSLETELVTYGYQFEIQDRSSTDSNVKAVFLKDNSLGKILLLKHQNPGTPKSIQIKLEVDINPPLGGKIEQRYIEFPVTVPVVIHDLPSLFAGKSHALLCRNWEKGRDWYDFIWYVGKKVVPNFALLSNAIRQMGPWKDKEIKELPPKGGRFLAGKESVICKGSLDLPLKGEDCASQPVQITPQWYIEKMRSKIASIDWEQNKKDISRFLKPSDLYLLKTWNQAFFLNRMELLENYLLSAP
jgi:predicted nucleotidyltransferase component of viral defense system